MPMTDFIPAWCAGIKRQLDENGEELLQVTDNGFAVTAVTKNSKNTLIVYQECQMGNTFDYIILDAKGIAAIKKAASALAR